MSIDSFNRLLHLAPPPEFPKDLGKPHQWSEIEQSIGTPLPSDYKRLIEFYGNGIFCDLLVVLNPFSSSKSTNLLARFDQSLDIYREGPQLGYTEQCPFLTFPEPGGLLTLAQDTNGGDMFWLTQGRPEDWPLVIYDWRGGYDYEQHSIGLVAFLSRWLGGELPDCFFGVGGSFLDLEVRRFQS